MTMIAIKSFDGLAPAVSPRLLDDNKAQTATNCLLESGKLVPLKGVSASVKAIASSQVFLWRYGNTASDTASWLTFATEAVAMKSPIPDDAHQRIYWNQASGLTYPRYAPASGLFSGGIGPYGTTYSLGVNAPAAAPSASCAAGTATLENRGYCCTHVTAYGEEGPPSAVSTLITINQGARVTLTGMPSTAHPSKNLTHKRLYRTVPGSDSASFRLTPVTWPSGAWGAANTTPTTDIPLNVTTVYDDCTADQLQEELQSQSWHAPPDKLLGLCLGGNGIAAGYTVPATDGISTLCFSEPYMPHAWPPEYQKSAGGMVVAMVPFGGTSWAVLTTSHPRIATGSDPASISVEKMTQPQACASSRSAVAIDRGVVYASPDGMCLLTTSGVQVLTEKLYSRAQWQALTPSGMHSYLYNGKVIVFHSAGALIFDLSGRGAMLTTTSTTCPGAYYDPISDELYMISGLTIVKWAGGSDQSLTWKSKVFSLPKPGTMAWAQVQADSYPVTAKFFADGTQMSLTAGGAAWTATVTSRDPFRLPSHTIFRDIEVEISGTATVHSVAIAQSSQELASA